MKGPVAFPFLTAQKSRVSALWNFKPAPAADGLLQDWEPSSSIAASVTLNVDLSGIREDCGLPAGSKLECALVWISDGTSLRGCLARKPLSRLAPTEEVVLDGVLDGASLGLKVDLSLIVVTGANEPLRPLQPLAPRRLGSLLWRTTRRILLEGTASRFPLEIIDFRSSGYPTRAPWLLDWDPEFPGDPLLGSVRLFVNAEHPDMAVMLAEEASDRQVWLERQLQFDVAAQLIRGLIAREHFVLDSDSYPTGSVGAHVSSLLKMNFPGDPIASLAEQLKARPGEFEARLKDALYLPSER